MSRPRITLAHICGGRQIAPSHVLLLRPRRIHLLMIPGHGDACARPSSIGRVRHFSIGSSVEFVNNSSTFRDVRVKLLHQSSRPGHIIKVPRNKSCDGTICCKTPGSTSWAADLHCYCSIERNYEKHSQLEESQLGNRMTFEPALSSYFCVLLRDDFEREENQEHNRSRDHGLLSLLFVSHGHECLCFGFVVSLSAALIFTRMAIRFFCKWVWIV